MDAAETSGSRRVRAPAKVPTRAERKRQAIAEAATEAFLSNGYTRTSMDDIARLAGVSKQTIYMHFGDKERLLFEVVMAIMTDGEPPVRRRHPPARRLRRSRDGTCASTLASNCSSCCSHARCSCGDWSSPRRSAFRSSDGRSTSSAPAARSTSSPACSAVSTTADCSASRRPSPRRVGLQLADHVRADQRGDAARRRPSPQPILDHQMGRSGRAHLPRRVRTPHSRPVK